MFEVFYLKDGIKKETASPERLKELIESGVKLWVDLVDSTKEEFSYLGNILDLHPVTVDDLSDEGTRVKIEVFENYNFIVLYNLFMDVRINKYEYDVVIGKNFIITNTLETNTVVILF